MATSLLSKIKRISKKSQFVKLHTLEDPIESGSKWQSEVSLVELSPKQFDIDKFKTLEDFAKQLTNPSHLLTESRKRKHESLESHPLLNESSVILALERCVKDETFFVETGLKVIIAHGCINHSMFNTLMDVILHYSVINVLQEFAIRSVFVPPKYTLKCLKHIIRLIGKDELRTLTSSEWDMKNAVDKTIFAKLSYVVNLPFDDLPMRNHLKLLSANEAVVLLQFLRCMLFVSSPALNFNEHALQLPCRLSEKQVIIWLDALLSSQISIFAASPTLKPIIQQMRKTLTYQQQFNTDVSSLAPYLNFLQEKMALPTPLLGKYAFQTVTI